MNVQLESTAILFYCKLYLCYVGFYRSLVFLVLGTLLIKCITCFMGLIIYTTYYDCDPLESKVNGLKEAALE
jgi:hypothetical protein